MSDKASATRARQACEPCRRKKTKCPGEKPICSFCARLGQRCTYEKGDVVTSRVSKSRRSTSQDSSGSKDRLQRLESRVEEVFDILSNFTSRSVVPTAAGSPATAQPVNRAITRSLTPTRDSNSPPKPQQGSHVLKFDPTHYPEPPADIWTTLIEIYQKKIDCQPLPVLGSQTLLTDPSRWTTCLRRSFLSLLIPFVKDHPFFGGNVSDAVCFYATSARQEILKNIIDGLIGADTLQACCLFALRDIHESNALASWMTIGVGIRFALSTRIMSNKHDPKVPLNFDSRSRCCWSLFVLDRMYGSTLTVPPALSTEDVMPNFPTSAQTPSLSGETPQSTTTVTDLGVMAYYMQLWSIWGQAMKYVQSVKDGEAEEAWTTQSQYHETMARLFEFETKYAQRHRFQQTRFQERDIETLENQRSYWAPWLGGQFLFHAIQGLINHPFLHIASRTRRQNFQPPSFQQNSIDQAVLHSSWILKCIEVCGETGFVIHDPFIAHLTAVTATIYLFLLNAKDTDLASQARHGFERCYTFIQGMGESWPHLRHTIDKLDILQQVAITNSSAPATSSHPKAQRSLLWELLDYSASTTPSQVPEFATDVVDLNVDTRFLSPLNPLSSGHTPAATIQQTVPQAQQNEGNQAIEEPLWDPSMDTMGFNLFDTEQMADLTSLTFGRDLWTFGQL